MLHFYRESRYDYRVYELIPKDAGDIKCPFRWSNPPLKSDLKLDGQMVALLFMESYIFDPDHMLVPDCK